MTAATEYQIRGDVADALRGACAAAAWSPIHAALLKGLQAVPGYEQLRASAVRDHLSDNPARILEGDRTVASSYRAWAREQLAAHGDDPQRVWSAHLGKGWTLTWTTNVLRYYWLQTGPHPWNGIQLTIRAEEEFAGGPVFQPERWNAPSSVEELLNPRESRQPDAPALSAGRYTLADAIDMEAFYRLGQRLHAESLARGAQRRVLVRPPEGDPYESTWGKVAPEGFRYIWRVQRWFQDWEFSSAGRSGAVAGQRWAFQVSDWDSGASVPSRVLDFVPMWSHTARIAKIENISRLSDQALYAKLLALDKRTGAVPFAWFFYLLHGNLVQDETGLRILQAARRGDIELAEHDYRVLLSWGENRYGF